MNGSHYPWPTLHYDLRALLRVIERAYDQNSVEALDDARDLAGALPPECHENLRTYIGGLLERIRNEERDYRLHTDIDIDEAKEALEKIAYGDFDEAMMKLEYDLRSLDRYRNENEMESRVFRPELFSNEDREKWNELQAVVAEYLPEPFSEENDKALEDAVASLRSYQQRSHGALVPTMTATYRNGNEGTTVRLAWVDEGLQVATHAPFYEELDDFFINTSPIESRADFLPSRFPKSVGEYKLGGIMSANLFQYEL
jgi:hypothetical protein